MNVAVSVYIYSVVPEFTLRFYTWMISRLFYSIKVEGHEHIPKEGSFVLAANHVSYVDWLLLGGACKRPCSYVMYYKFFEIPVIRSLMKQARVIPIAGAKEDKQILDRAFARIASELKDQNPVCIFPEGQLTRDGALSPFRPGILKMVKSNPVPVVPVVLHGVWGSIFSHNPKRRAMMRRQIKIEFLKPIEPSELTMEVLEILLAEKLGEIPPHQKQNNS